MYWIALLPSPHEPRAAWGWRALQFTPRVAEVEEALLLEASASERLFGGRKRLLRRLLKTDAAEPPAWAQGASALEALACLRLRQRGEELPAALPDDLPLWTLSAARPHLATLERIGCTTFGQLRLLPRAGLSRRFGAELLQALDAAFGQRPERYPWLALPSTFDQKLELQSLATSAPELLGAGQHLLTLLQAWLQARNLGVLALELEWTLDLKRLNGKPLPPTEKMELRTAQPTQEIRHLRRLASEQLHRASLSAPANHLRLRTLETVPWGGVSTSLLPEDNKPGERLHQLVERLSVRLGEGNVTVPEAHEDHRPECMQEWIPARGCHSRNGAPVGWVRDSDPNDARSVGVARSASRTQPTKQPTKQSTSSIPEAFPPWLLRAPLRLQVKADKPWYQGPLQLLTRARRLEGAWWDEQLSEPVVRDYFIARGETVGLLWIYRERLHAEQDRAQWFLHGIYA
ncbi:MAG TPA: DNA polymerase Y family protein [Ramlibacter sp.]|nr:DNA polymerase Y family protein [Ramlibacter sp.]